MNKAKQILLFGFLLIPYLVFAHGEDVLISLLIQVVSAIAFLIFVLLIKMSLKKKLILTTVYISSVFIIEYFISDLPYTKNMNLINSLFAFVPVALVLLCLLVYKFKGK